MLHASAPLLPRRKDMYSPPAPAACLDLKVCFMYVHMFLLYAYVHVRGPQRRLNICSCVFTCMHVSRCFSCMDTCLRTNAWLPSHASYMCVCFHLYACIYMFHLYSSIYVSMHTYTHHQMMHRARHEHMCRAIISTHVRAITHQLTQVYRA